MKVRIVLDGSRYYLHDVSNPVATRRIERTPGKALYFTKRAAAESHVAAREAQGWEIANA